MEQKRPRWVDKPEFDWTPETPLRFEPSAREKPANDPLPPPANRNPPLPAAMPRLAIGLGQGLLLTSLFYGRDHNLPPDNGLIAGLIMMLTFAPTLLVQGLGRISVRPLLIWASFAAACLFGLGVYHHWRVGSADADYSGLWLAGLVSAFLLIGQSLLLGHARSGPGPVRYAVLYESTWRLTAEAALCGVFALFVWCLWSVCKFWLPLRVGSSLLFHLDAPLVTLSLALASQFRAGPLLHLLKRGSVMAFTAVLPFAIIPAAFTILFGSLSHWRAPFALSGLEGLLLIAAINASYRSGNEWRPHWRRRAEFVAACLLLPLAVLAGVALQARIGQFGFTAPRVIAVAGLLMLSAYGIAYTGAALISLSGGRWMERIENANLLMAFVAMSLIATLLSPLGDPVRLAVANQNWRVMHGRVAPEAFDCIYLRRSGMRFGHEALTKLAKAAGPCRNQGRQSSDKPL